MLTEHDWRPKQPDLNLNEKVSLKKKIVEKGVTI